jgi:phage virion morphogenesis protein
VIKGAIVTGPVLAELNRLHQNTANLSPAARKIGETLKESTQKRFESATAPDGTAWALNKPSTLEHKKGSRPLTDGGTLGDTIDYQLRGEYSLLIGSPAEQAAMMQFGGTKSEFPNLWGDIEGRAFLGISDEDETDILNILERHLNL